MKGLYTKHLKKLAADNPNCTELRNLSMAADYVPMLSAKAAQRYGCRQKGCGLIPKSETDWFQAVQPEGQGNARKWYWFCPACGGQYTYNTKGTENGETDSRGQNKTNQYVLFFSLPWRSESGFRTFCAKAAEPDDIQKQQLNVL